MAISAGVFVFFTQDFRYVALMDLGLISKWNRFFGLRPKVESCAVERLGGTINSMKVTRTRLTVEATVTGESE